MNANVTMPTKIGKTKAKKNKSREVSEQELHAYCHCLAHPAAALATRIPDVHVTPTAAQKLTQEYILSSDGAGNVVDVVGPSLARNRYVGTLSGSTVTALAFAAHPDYAEILAAFDYGRVVAIEVALTYIGPTQTASGRLAIVTDPATSYLTTGAVGTGSDINNMFDDGFSGAARDGGFAVVRPKVAHGFELLSLATLSIPAFDHVYIAAMGLPNSTPCFSVRVTKHVELVPKKASVWRGGAAVELFSPSVMAQAANMGMIGVIGSYADRAMHSDTAKQAAAYAGRFIAEGAAKIGRSALNYGAKEAEGALLALMA